MTRTTKLLLVVGLGWLTPVFAQGDGAAEDLATAEAFVKVCSDQFPDRATEFRATLAPPFSCVSNDASRDTQSRESVGYRAQFDVISAEMVRMPKEQVLAFCDSLLQKHC